MMEREILIANTKTQTRSKITTAATTLGELKAALDAAGVDYSGMTFTEGISKTQLLDDATQLPQNLMYKGKATNNLVILLTNTKKNIASGIYAEDRKACYSIIKEHNLQDAVKEEFGRNFTQVPTTDLQNFVAAYTVDYDKGSDYDVDDDKAISYFDSKKKVDTPTTRDLFNSLMLINSYFIKKGIFGYEDLKNLENLFSNAVKDMENVAKPVDSKPVSTSDGSIDDDDIDNMLNDLEL